jgi:hypothetical protein
MLLIFHINNVFDKKNEPINPFTKDETETDAGEESSIWPESNSADTQITCPCSP